MTVHRHDLSEAEASLLWSIAHFGGGESLVNILEPRAQGIFRPKVVALAKLETADRARLVDAWGTADRAACGGFTKVDLAARALWQEAGDFSIQKLSLAPARELPMRIMKVGLFQFAVALREQDRRQIIRVRREMGEGLGDLLECYLRHDRVVSPEEVGRVREVIIVLSRRYESIEDRLGHLGMYFVACAAGLRFRRQVRKIAKELGGELGRALLWYYRGCVRSRREGLEAIARLALDELSLAHAKEGSRG